MWVFRVRTAVDEFYTLVISLTGVQPSKQRHLFVPRTALLKHKNSFGVDCSSVVVIVIVIVIAGIIMVGGRAGP